jgi:hypothetical protein
MRGDGSVARRSSNRRFSFLIFVFPSFGQTHATRAIGEEFLTIARGASIWRRFRLERPQLTLRIAAPPLSASMGS